MAAIFTAATFGAFAQSDDNAKPLRFSAGLEAAMPFGDFADMSSFGIGGTVQANYALDSKLSLTFNTGYIYYSGKATTTRISVPGFPDFVVESPKVNIGMIPVLAGIEYNFTPNVFASGQLGLTFGSGNATGSNFTYAPGIGYRFTENISALVKYTGMSSKGGGSLSSAGVRIAYTF